MTEDEIEGVAEELAKAGGLSWYPGRQNGSLLRVVSDRYRDQARLAIAALHCYRAPKASADPTDSVKTEPPSARARGASIPDTTIHAGATVIYRPPGERRAYPCRVERVEGGQVYLVPHLRAWTGWVPIENLSLAPSEEDSLGRGTINACPALHGGSDTVSEIDDEIEVVAAELAKAGGVSWPSEQGRGPLRLIMDRYRDRARLAIATLDRLRIAKHSPGEIKVERPGPAEEGDVVSEGSLVLYSPSGDKRTYPCRIEKVEGSRVYLVPELPTCTGWVDLANLSSPAIQ